MKKIFLTVVLIFVVCNFFVYGYMFANETDSAWPPPPNTSPISSTPINQLIFNGGSAFLLSISEYQKYLYLFEQDKTDQSFSIIHSAYNQIAIAYMNFIQAHQQTIGKPCDAEVIESLKNFDYETYKSTNDLIEEIFYNVKGYLKDCRISSWYLYIALKMEKIMNGIYSIKMSIENGISPSLSLLWRLNQEFMKVSLEGQYCSELFINATKKL